MDGFHFKDGWCFKREADGSVLLRKFADARLDTSPVIAEATIDPASWASIVASVSALGETGTTWRIFKAAQEG